MSEMIVDQTTTIIIVGRIFLLLIMFFLTGWRETGWIKIERLPNWVILNDVTFQCV